jgi:periplasmic protein TonB
MGLRCFLFTSDEATARTIGQILASLEIEAESCPDAIAATEKIGNDAFQIVIIDWEKQPEAGLLLATARDRKAAERAITLAIVGDDPSVPKALQAGANSVLRKPLAAVQVKDTLTTARDLVRAKKEPSPAALSAKASASSASPAPLPKMEAKAETNLRAGDFLQAAPPTPGGSYVTENGVPASMEQSSETPVDPLQDLEPVAAAVQERPAAVPPHSANEGRGLEWYLKNRGITRQSAPAPAAQAPSGAKPELLGYDQTPSSSAAPNVPKTESMPARPSSSAEDDQKKEAELFAYIDGNRPDNESPRRGFRLGKGAIFTAFLLASLAVAAAPQAPWHPHMRNLWSRGQRALHAWLNPQPVTTAQTPVTHESFARPGDEYKLPTAEAIPDATTDPSQIQVLPVVDPLAKKPNSGATNPDQAPAQADPFAPPSDQSQSAPIQVKEAPPQATPEATPTVVAPAVSPAATTVPTLTAPPRTESTPSVSVPSPAPLSSSPRVLPPPRQPSMPGNIPSSLRSQMASSTPEASGNKPIDAALPSIEPVVLPESTERPLLIEQPPMPYPASAKGQAGTVILQVLIGRDGTVQDAKFLQGSLLFARTAIEGVRQWKFKPYLMNGRPVSVQTTLAITLKPSPGVR